MVLYYGSLPLRIEYKMHDVAANERPRLRHVMHFMTCSYLIGAFIFDSKGQGPVRTLGQCDGVAVSVSDEPVLVLLILNEHS